MSNAVPQEVFGLAVFVNVLSFLAVFLGILLCFMLWRHGEGLSYILMLSVGTTLGAIQGVVTHLDYTINWRQIQIIRYEESQKPHYDETAMFGKSDNGWRSVFSWLAIYLYNVDSLLVLFWAITLFIGTWNIRVKSVQKKTMAVIFKVTAVILPAIMIGICQITVIRTYPFVFLIVVNIIMTVSMIVGFVLVLAILYKYLVTRNIFKRSFAHSSSLAGGGSASLGTVSSVTTGSRNGNRRTTTDKWLIIRFSIIMVILIIFEAALIVYELVNFQRSSRTQDSQTKSSIPDLSVDQAKVDLFQYIPGVVPSIVAFCIFGTTATFRKEYIAAIKACCCCCLRKQQPGKPSSLWRRFQSRPYGRQRSVDVEASQRHSSRPKGAKSGIAVEVKTEISLSPISSLKPTVMSPRRVSFGGTSVISDESGVRHEGFTNQCRGPISPPLSRSTSRGAPLSIPRSYSHTDAVRIQSFGTRTPRLSTDKALPKFPPQAAHVAIPTFEATPTTKTPANADFLDISSAQGPSWLSTDSKPSSTYASSENELSRTSTIELVPPPLSVPLRSIALRTP